jgi:hypothetical protein
MAFQDLLDVIQLVFDLTPMLLMLMIMITVFTFVGMLGRMGQPPRNNISE